MNLILPISLGAVLGALSRHFLVLYFSRLFPLIQAQLPFSTLIVNVLGSFFMGLFIELAALKFSVSPELRAFISVGFLSSFTTLSSVALDFTLLTEKGDLLVGIIYIALSVVLSVLAVFLAFSLVRMIG